MKKFSYSEHLTNLNDVKVIQAKDILKQVLQVHLPGNELLKFKNIDWEENSCTEEIQRRLSDGWSIIAVIPQTGNRRPDYILGKE